MGVTLVYAVLIVIANTVVGMAYGWLDPRVTIK
jgi:ABC-type dipeptide/oligopeptide/nickel transport system permease component